MAEWIKFAIPELEVFCRKFHEEEQREMKKIKRRFVSLSYVMREDLLITSYMEYFMGEFNESVSN